MKKEIIISILAAAALCGCQKEEQSVPDSNPKAFTATIDDSFSCAETKTSLDSQGNVLWKQGDQISIFAGSTINEHWQVTDASDGKTAAELNKISGAGFNAGGEIDNNVAFYPYSSENTVAKSEGNYVIGAALPSVQNYAEASFGNGAFPMSAVTSSTTDMNLKFKNILGGLKLQLKGTATIASISISGNNDEILCGAANVTASVSGKPSINLTDGSAKTVTLDCGDGVQLDADAATPFVIALPPMTMTGGFTVTVTDTEGKQMEIKTTKSQTIARSSILKMPAVTYEGTPVVDYSSEPFTITSIGSTAVSIKRDGYRDKNVELFYRVGAGSWNEYSIGTVVDLLDGETLQFRAGDSGNDQFSLGYMGMSSYTSSDSYYYLKVIGDGNIIASGNIMSLLDKDLRVKHVPDFCFCSLFENCSSLIDASHLILPSTSLSTGCYLYLFANCKNLTAAPELPATSLAVHCYTGMFQECSSLITAPALPSTTMASRCYTGMFAYCVNLTKAPDLDATTLADNCYERMFKGCTGLISAPALPAKILAGYCYEEMFSGCTSLTEAPELPSMTLTQGCYYNMFYECSKLNYVKALFTTTPAVQYTLSWLSGVSSTGTFVKNIEADWDVTGDNGVPSGWTVLTE